MARTESRVRLLGTRRSLASQGTWRVIGLGNALVLCACNAILGIEEGSLGDSCVLNSDCAGENEVCLFRVCSPPCETSKDCEDGARCLQTEIGRACVADNVGACDTSQECPEGTECLDGECRTSCGDDGDCLAGQSCVRGGCQSGSFGGFSGTGATAGTSEGGDSLVQAGAAGREPGLSGSGGTGPDRIGEAGSSEVPEAGAAGRRPGLISGGAGGEDRTQVWGGAGGAGVSPATGGAGVSPATGGAGVTPATGGAGVVPAAGGAGAGGSPAGQAGSPACEVEGQLLCNGLAQAARSVCRGGVWEPADPCGEGELCDTLADVSGDCQLIVPECVGQESGAAICSGATRIACGPDLVTAETTPCDGVEHCRQSTTNGCAACLEGEYRCTGDTLEVCNPEHTGFDFVRECTEEPCNAALGRCTTLICQPDAYSCEASTNTLRLCNADGTAFLAEQSCGTGICDAENGECDICAPNEVMDCVDDLRKRVCDAQGQATVSVLCSSEDAARPVCIGNGLCVACTPSVTQCIDEHRVQSCNAQGQWDTPAYCTGQACASESCTGVCEPGATMCEDEFSMRTCSLVGAWDPPEACAQQACEGTSCTGVCVPETTQCADKFSIQICATNGTWGDPVACTGQACAQGVCTGTCVPESTECVSSTVLHTCGDDGVWGPDATCTGQACYQDECTGVCVPGTPECTSATQIRTCGENGMWDAPAPCTNQACSGDACVGVCSPNTERCSSNTPQVCSLTGTWEDETAECLLPDLICQYAGGDAACVDNPPYSVGYDAPFSNTTGVLQDWILGNPIVLTQAAHVVSFGLIAVQNSSCMVRMALYADSAGAPTALLGYSTQVSPSINAQTYELAPVAQINVDAGTYWLMAHYSCNATAYAFDDASAPDLVYATATYGTLPDPFPTTGVTTITTFALNQYLVVQDLP